MGSAHEGTIDSVGISEDSATISYTKLIISFILIFSVYHYYTNIYCYFKRRGIRAPRPYPLVGNLVTVFFSDRMKLEREWSQRYGKLYGNFYGTRPKIIVNDAEILRQVCIKDFDSAPNHAASELLNHYQKNALFFTQDDHWKRLRALQSPTFTSGKIKRMFRLLDKCADDLVLCFSEHLDNDKQQLKKAAVNVKEVYSLYTMDSITTAAYTIKLDRKSTPNAESTRNNFVEAALKIFSVSIPRLFMYFVLPNWFLRAIGFNVLPLSYFTDLDNRIRPIVHRRIKSGKKGDDYLQILVDARLDDEIELNELDEKENHHAALTKTSLKSDQDKMIKDIESSRSTRGNLDSPSPSKPYDDDDHGAKSKQVSNFKLTEHEVISSAIFLLSVGVETTATLLTNCTYALAFHPDIQHRLYEVIKSIAEFNSETGEYSFDYDKLTSCEYLDAVVSETLRNLAPVILADRVVSRDCYLEACNVQLRKGDELHLSYYSIMNNPEYWPDPLKFDPERFMGDNKKKIVPGSYCPFGLGPRHCLGMRFSLTEAKLAVAKVLMRFKFTPVPGTSFPPECGRIHGLSNLKIPQVEIVARA